MAHRKAPMWGRAVVHSTTPVTDSIRHILLDVDRHHLIAPPGSHVDLLVPAADGSRLVRSYSVVDNGRNPGALGIAVRLDPQSRGGSAFMHSLRAGDELTVSQPIQDFELSPGRPRYALLAGGIGITPMISMAHVLRQRGADYELIYVGRSRSTMAFLDELEDDHPGRLQVLPDDETGILDCKELVARLAEDTELYVCGPPALLTETQRQWREADRPPGLLRFETFGSGGALPTLPFEIRVRRTGSRTAVPADQTALQALQAAGEDVMYDCLRGECGLCVVPVEGSEGPIDHRDVFLSPHQKSLDNQICLCVSRVAGGTVTVDLP